jgi:adenylate cyclase
MRVFLILLILASMKPTFATPNIVLEDNKSVYNVSPSLQILEDPTHSLSIENITHRQNDSNFIDNNSVSPNFGFTKSSYWVRFTVENHQIKEDEFFLEVGFPLIDQITLYEYKQNKWKERTVGILFPFQYREIKNRNFVFPIKVLPGSINTYYLRFKSEDTLQIPMSLWTKKEFFKKNFQEQFIFGIYYGILVVMALFNIMLYFSIRDNSYLFYVFYISIFGVFTASQYGLAYEYLWPNFNWGARLMNPFLAGLLEFNALVFTISFLQIKRYLPRMYTFIIILCLLSLMASVLPFTLSFYYSVIAVTAIAFCVLSVMFVCGYLTFRSGYRPARYFMLAFLSIIISAALYVFKTFGLIPNTLITNYGLQIGSAIEMILLSLGIADKINVSRKEKTIAKKLQLEEAEKAIELGKVFQKYVPLDFLRLLHKENISEIQLGDQVLRNISIIFVNIRNFSSISKNLEEEEIFNFINYYLNIMAPIIHKNHGFIDKYIGEGIMALFDSSADNAVSCAIEMQNEIYKLNKEREKNNQENIILDIGINTGEIILGTVGGKSRISTTVIGDAVNTASRVSYLNRIYDKSLLISENTYQAIENKNQFKMEWFKNVNVKGKSNRINIYEIK